MATTHTAQTGTIIEPGTWSIDASHSSVEFVARHLMVTKVRGRFGEIDGTITIADDPFQSSVRASVDAASVSSGDEKRDAHLRSADFFDVEQFPTITFKSTAVTKTDDGFSVVGDLTMHGITKPVTLEVEDLSAPSKDPWGNTRVGTSAKAKVNRRDYGLSWNAALETGGVVVGDQIKITIDVSLIATAAKSAAA
jgi:polyisoprenoid-binding protein YceI